MRVKSLLALLLLLSVVACVSTPARHVNSGFWVGRIGDEPVVLPSCMSVNEVVKEAKVVACREHKTLHFRKNCVLIEVVPVRFSPCRVTVTVKKKGYVTGYEEVVGSADPNAPFVRKN